MDRQQPVGVYSGINANFGQFRNHTGTYRAHDGIDYRAGIGTPIFPVSPGTAHVYPADNPGWGRYVDIDHGSYYTRYTHLDRIDVVDGQWVTTTTTLGLSGQTNGGVNPKMGPHLHFGLGTPNAATDNTMNPILAGLKQPLYGELKIIEDPKDWRKIKLLGTGSDETFRGENEPLQVVQSGKPVLAVIEAYHKHNKYSNPYKVVFEIENTTDHYWPKKIKEIVFDNMAHILANFDTDDGYYCFAKPYVTYASSESSYADYYFIKFYPTAGIYKITVKIYSCYRDDSGFHLSDPETVTRTITVGLVGLDFNTAGYSYAWLPDDIAGRGIMLASTPTPVGAAGVRASGAAVPAIPEVFYAFANNNVITTNLLDVDPNLQQTALIEARATPEADWLIEIRNKSGGAPVDRISVAKCGWLRKEWGAGKSPGEYTFTVTATNAAGITTYEAYDTITIDNTKPSALVYSLNNSVATAEQIITTKIRPSENLRSLLVNVVKDSDYSLVEERIYSSPFVEGNTEVQVDWEDAIAYPDGFYRLQYVMTDVAGNIAKAYSPVVSVNKSGGYTAPSTTVEVSEPALPELPKWEDRPKVSDIAFDSAGNQYVLYGRYNKLVKYDSSGNVIKTLTGVGTSEFRLPLGLAVSPSGDRVYVADTFSNRVLIYDANLQPIKELKGKYVYKEQHKVKHHDEYCIVVKSGDVYPEPSTYHDWEGFKLPKDIKVVSSGDFYVVDNENNRLLKFDRAGEASIFSNRFADFKNDMQKMWDDGVYRDIYIGRGGAQQTIIRKNDFWIARKYDYYDIYSNSLNDAFYFVRADIGDYYHVGSGGQFARPTGTAIDSSSSLYIADTGNHRIQKFAPDGSFVVEFGEGILKSPKGIDIDSYGSVWVADTGNQRIVQFNAIGEFVREYKSDEYAINPQKIKIKDGKIYIADANFNKPLVWNIGGELANVRTSSAWFSPSGNSTKGPIKISYALSQPADATIQLIPKTEPGITALGAGGGIVLDKIARGVGMNQEVWDGKLSSITATSTSSTPEAAIPDGQYTLKIAAAFGDYVKTKTVAINIDNTKPSLALNRDPPGISPNADGVKDILKIDYTLSDNLSPTSEVKLYLWKNGRILDVLLDKQLTTNNTAPSAPTTDNFIWNGKIGSYVIEGNYILELKATDLAGNTAKTTAEVLVDFQPPRIEAINVSNPYFSPNGDGRKDETEIKFNLYDTYAKRMPVTVLVVDKNDEQVAEIIRRQELPVGEHCFTWEGSPLPLVPSEAEGLGEGSGVRAVTDGEYKFKIYAEDYAGNLANVNSGPVVVDTVPPTIESFAANPNPFTPNNDGIKDTTRFSFEISEPSYTDIQIHREDGRLFRKYFQNFTGSSSGSIPGNWTWDGRGSRYELLGGNYTYNLVAEDLAGNITTSETNTIFVDCSPSLVPYIYADPDPFSPTNPRNNLTNINYYLVRDNIRVTLNAVGQDGQILKRLVRGEVQGKGEHSTAWDGSFDPDYTGPKNSKDRGKITDGTYEFRIYAEDLDGGEPADITNTVIVDTVQPNILTYPVNVNYEEKRAALKYVLPETASVEVSAFTDAGNPVSTIKSGTESPGEHWAIFNTPGSDYRELTYMKVTATDRAFNQAEKTSELFSVVPREALQVTGISARPTPFTPNGDGLMDITRISYQISGGAPEYRVSMDIQTQTGSTVKSLLVNDPQGSGIYSFYWDGSTLSADGGLRRIVPDGYYDYVISAEDKLGMRVEGRGTVLLVSTRPTVGLSTSLPVFSPNGDGSKDTVILNYSIGYPTFYITGEALVKLEVLNASGEAVWSRVFNHTAGSYVYEYDGTFPLPLGEGSGVRALNPGNYYVRASAEDALGSTAIPKTVSLQVDYNEPIIAVQSVAPTPFSPHVNGVKDQTAISYTLAKPAYVSIKVKQGDGVIKSLQTDQWTEAYIPSSGLSASKVKAFGIPTVTWNGRNEAGSFAADGNYTIEISAIDSAGNSYQTSQMVEVDNSLPVIPVVDSLPANTNQGLQNVAGAAEQNSLLKVYINDNPASSGNASATGIFSIPTNLYVGANQLKLTATDAAGNTSDYSSFQSIAYETDAPIISNVAVTPNPAKAGPVSISFTVSETLESNPLAKVNTETATFSRRFPTSTDLNYEYTYNVTSSAQQGAAAISIEAHDLAGNVSTFQTSNVLTIDTISSIISNVDIDVEGNPRGSSPTAYAKLGSKVTIDFSVSEELLADPVVSAGGRTTTKESRTAYSPDRIDYSYYYTVTDTDPDGTTPVSIEAVDLANNLTTYRPTGLLVIDKTSPEVANLSVTPNPASVPSVSGQVSIKFNVSEPLKEAPKVYVMQNGAVPQSVPVFGLCEAKYDVVPGYDGQVIISIEAIDLASNAFVYSFPNSLIADTVKPAFSNVQSEIGSNPEFTKFAKEGSAVAISLRSSEQLKFNPDVRVNGNPTNYDSLNLGDYTYKYTVTDTDTNGNATIEISGLDFAGNEGAAETSSSSESFVIDLINPTVAISDNPDLIANPGHFATNASPADTDLQTSLRYEISEPGYVTTRVYKVDNTDISYTRNDFVDAKLIKILENNVFKDAGIYYKDWNGSIEYNKTQFDANGNNFADPGKYAFLIEVRDRAGNVTQRLWGGTVWIQDNILKVQEPEQLNPDGTQMTNPHPKYFSPKNHPGDESYGFAKYRFKVLLGVTPKSYEEPKRIEVMGIEDDYAWLEGVAKKGGYYTVRIYDEAGSLVRTLESKEFVTATNYVASWEGKNDAGQFVPDGKYYFKVDARDYLGGQAFDNLMTREVYVDNTYPEVIDNQAGDDTWKNNSRAGDTYNVDFRDNGTYPSKLAWAQYRIRRPNGTYTEWQNISGVNGRALFDTDWSIDFNACGEGTNYIYVKAQDIAGNLIEPSSYVFYVKKDINPPRDPLLSITNTYDGGTDYTRQRNVNLSVSAVDDYSGVSEIQIRNDGESYQSFTSNPWALRDADGTRYVYVKFRDGAGNWTADDIRNGDIALDRVAPSISSASDSPDPISPGNRDLLYDTSTISFSLNETASVTIRINGISENLGECSSGSYIWDPQTPLSDGSYTYSLKLVDAAGNDSGWIDTGTITVDNTPPTISNVSDSPDPFTPNGDGVCDTATISYSLSETASVTITIKDKNGNLIHTANGGSSSYVWDGTGATKVGKYTYYIDAKDSVGNSASTKSGTVKIRDKSITVGMKNSYAAQDYSYQAFKWKPSSDINMTTLTETNWPPTTHQWRYDELKNMVAGDFNGDGKDEVVGMKNDYNAADYTYAAFTWHPDTDPTMATLLQENWPPTTHQWRYDELKNMVAGDFDGDGRDEVVGMKNDYNAADYTYAAFTWHPDTDRNMTTLTQENWPPTTHQWRYDELKNMVAGDFDGDGKDEVVGIKKSYTSSDYYYQAFIWHPDTDPNMTTLTESNWPPATHQWAFSEMQNAAAGDFDVRLGIFGFAIKNANQLSQSATPELPTLITPEKDKQDVRTLRPTFEWKHRKGSATEYKWELAENEDFTIGRKDPVIKYPSQGSENPKEPGILYFTYPIHEFDPGLDKDTYYWKVTALTTNEAATSEVWSFKIAPDLTLTGITNYPNPFKDKTTIRYRLSTDASEVKIRIYDITGSLVTELNGTTNGEGSSVWNKYNDVDWNGTNGRGDKVMNGIYPFEIVAKSGDKSVSGRGKIAVLK